MVPEALGVHALGLLQKQLNFLAGENLGIFPLHLRRRQSPGGIRGQDAGGNHEFIEGFGRGQKPRHRCGGLALSMHPVHIVLDHFRRGAAQIAVLLHVEELLKLGHVPQIGGHRVGGGVLFRSQVFFVKRQILRCHGARLLSYRL
ncbi:hypothetical protein SDC9_140686 [bioreactor metagenome]|uniref:Uncharacterized protein n=1 Tax=bioreactor metagenome TaxID=1076179 RepID=A0A645DVZ8_9ZZZZ